MAAKKRARQLRKSGGKKTSEDSSQEGKERGVKRVAISMPRKGLGGKKGKRTGRREKF